MKVDGIHYRTIWPADGGSGVTIIDQTRLPFEFDTVQLVSLEDCAQAIEQMRVRGAPLIGITAAFGLALALRVDPSDAGLEAAQLRLARTRPTAVNLAWALGEVAAAVANQPLQERAARAFARAEELADEDAALCASIGGHGLSLIKDVATREGVSPSRPVNILTHCNAGWLATVDSGTALAPVYRAFDAGIPVHVWVDETRPRNQGALTAWELGAHGVPHTVIVDNAGGQLMREGRVDLCITGTDCTTADGDVVNKIGTYLKALAAFDNNVPFYVALPGPTIDWHVNATDIPIERRAADEVLAVTGSAGDRGTAGVSVYGAGTHADNPGFDVTPARLVTALITERGVCAASREGLAQIYPEQQS
jgi:methylthioribose-1-phosphate isomerase